MVMLLLTILTQILLLILMLKIPLFTNQKTNSLLFLEYTLQMLVQSFQNLVTWLKNCLIIE